MSAALSYSDRAASRDLVFGIQNTSDRDTVLVLGTWLDFFGCMKSMRLILTTPDGVRHRASCGAVLGGIGEITYSMIPLLAGASYSWRRSVEE
jgi:hypothetical protein